ncbi:DUF6190 family protein [Actinokineospora cianjurensis]|uniref:Uncharacterized protein n=1 Tax=Actinokineospora cianjurensis TaxID=585224 RepID=A0A421BBT1_9PSEU|nr:DUF6190 family protein [Actinokineospora cianjurensis]RLK61803.1 hypothetical protein CLV68_2344 [Actinokineospora cianjurensis]
MAPATLVAEFVDAALFMGMHSADERVRLACKGFFVDRLATGVVMSLEQVGRCDDIVWSYPREVQDAYYPFMDNLHTDMAVSRVGYTATDVTAALGFTDLAHLPLTERLTVSQVVARGGTLFTVDSRYPTGGGLPVRGPDQVDTEPVFPDKLEQLYRESLVLRVAHSAGGRR